MASYYSLYPAIMDEVHNYRHTLVPVAPIFSRFELQTSLGKLSDSGLNYGL